MKYYKSPNDPASGGGEGEILHRLRFKVVVFLLEVDRKAESLHESSVHYGQVWVPVNPSNRSH